MIKPRQALRGALRRLLPDTAAPEAETEVASEVADLPPAEDVLVRDAAQLPEADPWQSVQRARDLGRPTTLDYLERAFRDFEELHGDRFSGECRGMVGGIAKLGRTTVVVVGHQRGHTARELTDRNYGMPSPAGYRKAARLMRLAAKLGLPLVTFIDTPGAYPGAEAEEQGQAGAISQCIGMMTSLPIPIVTVIIGEGGSGGALALAVADEVLINEHGVYSVISPEGCASILWHDATMAPTAAAALKVDARNLLLLGVVDGVIGEPAGGSQADHQEAARRVASALHATLGRLAGASPGRAGPRPPGAVPGVRCPAGRPEDVMNDRSDLASVNDQVVEFLDKLRWQPSSLRVQAGDVDDGDKLAGRRRAPCLPRPRRSPPRRHRPRRSRQSRRSQRH